MLILAFRLMTAAPSEHLKEVMELFGLTTLEICEGQQLDMEFESRCDVTEDEYIEMIRLKTAVLLAASLKIGAILAGATAAHPALHVQAGQGAERAHRCRLRRRCRRVYW